MITGIVVALPEELTTLTSKKIDKGQCIFLGDNVMVSHSGAGSENARSSAEQLISQGATRLISWGCAAGLSASVQPGDLIVADQLIDAEYNEIAVNSDWRNYSIHILKQQTGKKHIDVQGGPIAESKRLISDSDDKKQYHTKTGALALDMESAAIAKVARLHNLEFLAIRAIADPVTMNLPKSINYSLSNEGEILMGKLLRYLALHPSELPGLVRLGLHFNQAKRTLIRTASQLESITGFSDFQAIETL